MLVGLGGLVDENSMLARVAQLVRGLFLDKSEEVS